MDPICLLADIGGTNTRVALSNGHNLNIKTITRYKNIDFDAFDDVLIHFLENQGINKVDQVCVAAAGHVCDGRASMTNLDWSITISNIKQVCNATHVSLLNDLQAQGHAIKHLGADDLHCVMKGNHPQKNQDTQLVCGLGTGFNAAPIYQIENKTYIPPAEAGHFRLPITGSEQREIAKRLSYQYPFLSVEHILSGRGIERLDQAMNTQTRSAAQIMEAAQSGDESALSVAQMMADFTGAVMGDLALIMLPLGGIYLSGGVSRALIPYFSMPRFAQAFSEKGKFSQFNRQFSVSVILDDFAALKGCAHYLTQQTS